MQEKYNNEKEIKSFYNSVNKSRTNLLIETDKDLNIHIRKTISKINQKNMKDYKKSFENFKLFIENPTFSDAVQLDFSKSKDSSIKKMKKDLFLNKNISKAYEINEKKLNTMRLKLYKFEISNKDEVNKFRDKKKNTEDYITKIIEEQKVTKGGNYLFNLCSKLKKIKNDDDNESFESESTDCQSKYKYKKSYYKKKNF